MVLLPNFHEHGILKKSKLCSIFIINIQKIETKKKIISMAAITQEQTKTARSTPISKNGKRWHPGLRRTNEKQFDVAYCMLKLFT